MKCYLKLPLDPPFFTHEFEDEKWKTNDLVACVMLLVTISFWSWFLTLNWGGYLRFSQTVLFQTFLKKLQWEGDESMKLTPIRRKKCWWRLLYGSWSKENMKQKYGFGRNIGWWLLMYKRKKTSKGLEKNSRNVYKRLVPGTEVTMDFCLRNYDHDEWLETKPKYVRNIGWWLLKC